MHIQRGGFMEAIDVIKSRRSVRSYTNQMPSQEQIDQVVEVAQTAPNAGRFITTVVKDTNLLTTMDEVLYDSMIAGGGWGKERASLPGYRPLYDAPVLIIFSAAAEDGLGAVNTACACTAGAYAAKALELGSCFVMGPQRAYSLIDGLGEKLGLPEGFVPTCGLLLGFEKEAGAYACPSHQDPVVYV